MDVTAAVFADELLNRGCDDMSFVLEHMRDNLWRGKFSSFSEENCIHGLSGRLGGVSQKPYASLNMALHVGDEPEAVWENRQRFLHALGLKAEELVTPEQIHGINIERVGRKEAGRGAQNYQDSIGQTDALVTDEPGLPLMLCFADCTPVMFLDPVNNAVGIAHGGWKGTAARIAQQTVGRMQAEFGTDPADLLAGIGPAIGPCCYEVGSEVADQFCAAFPGHEADLIHDQAGGTHLNLWEANRLQLLEAGLTADHIDMAATCTACSHQWFYSYRADGGRTGRMAAVIALNKY